METKAEREAKMWQEHEEKYEALAQQIGIDALKRLVPISTDKVRQALANDDKHFNDISSLSVWDRQDPAVRLLAKYAGIKSWSLGYTVCVLKHVARTHYLEN